MSEPAAFPQTWVSSVMSMIGYCGLIGRKNCLPASSTSTLNVASLVRGTLAITRSPVLPDNRRHMATLTRRLGVESDPMGQGGP